MVVVAAGMDAVTAPVATAAEPPTPDSPGCTFENWGGYWESPPAIVCGAICPPKGWMFVRDWSWAFCPAIIRAMSLEVSMEPFYSIMVQKRGIRRVRRY